MTKIGAHMIVSGRVQGVGFRFTTQMKAAEVGVTGWVKNLPNDTVEVEVEGQTEYVYTFIDQIKAGPSPSAQIDDVELNLYEDLKDYQKFTIVY